MPDAASVSTNTQLAADRDRQELAREQPDNPLRTCRPDRLLANRLRMPAERSKTLSGPWSVSAMRHRNARSHEPIGGLLQCDATPRLSSRLRKHNFGGEPLSLKISILDPLQTVATGSYRSRPSSCIGTSQVIHDPNFRDEARQASCCACDA
jgi:hypothetical protein